MKFLAFARGLGSGFLDYWKWAAALAAVGALLASHVGAYHIGHRMAQADHMEEAMADQGATIANLNKNIIEAAEKGAALSKMLGSLGRAAAAARQEIQNVLPPPETDHACDYPAAARGLQNRASGYIGGTDLFGSDGRSRAPAEVDRR